MRKRRGGLTCDFDALCDFDRRMRMSESHEASISHVIWFFREFVTVSLRGRAARGTTQGCHPLCPVCSFDCRIVLWLLMPWHQKLKGQILQTAAATTKFAEEPVISPGGSADGRAGPGGRVRPGRLGRGGRAGPGRGGRAGGAGVADVVTVSCAAGRLRACGARGETRRLRAGGAGGARWPGGSLAWGLAGCGRAGSGGGWRRARRGRGRRR